MITLKAQKKQYSKRLSINLELRNSSFLSCCACRSRTDAPRL